MASKRQSSGQRSIPLSEWIAAAIGLILTSGAIGFLIYQSLFEDASAARIAVAVESIAAAESGHEVTFTVRNSGSRTAKGVAVEGELTKGGVHIETSHIEIDVVPAESQRRAVLSFSHDPQDYDLRLRVLGYQEP